jgi:hypothetical protein
VRATSSAFATIVCTAVVKPLKTRNDGEPYAKKIKLFNFILGCHIGKLGHPIGVDPGRFYLIAPYEPDARMWERTPWIDQYSGKRYRITASSPHGSRTVARVNSYGDVSREYEYHPEAKCADASGAPCSKQTRGLLSRWDNIAIDGLTFIGKESNKLEEVEQGSMSAESDVYAIYDDPSRNEWETEILPKVRTMKLPELEAKTALDRRTLQRILAGSDRTQKKRLY